MDQQTKDRADAFMKTLPKEGFTESDVRRLLLETTGTAEGHDERVEEFMEGVAVNGISPGDVERLLSEAKGEQLPEPPPQPETNPETGKNVEGGPDKPETPNDVPTMNVPQDAPITEKDPEPETNPAVTGTPVPATTDARPTTRREGRNGR